MNLISHLFQGKMVNFKIQTSNTSLFFKTMLISNKNITHLDTKMAYSYRWPLLYYMLFEETFKLFSLFLESLVNTKKKCHFLLTSVIPKWQNKHLLNWRCSQKSAYFGSFKHLRNTTTLLPTCWCFLNFKMTKNSFIWKKKK